MAKNRISYISVWTSISHDKLKHDVDIRRNKNNRYDRVTSASLKRIDKIINDSNGIIKTCHIKHFGNVWFTPEYED